MFQVVQRSARRVRRQVLQARQYFRVSFPVQTTKKILGVLHHVQEFVQDVHDKRIVAYMGSSDATAEDLSSLFNFDSCTVFPFCPNSDWPSPDSPEELFTYQKTRRVAFELGQDKAEGFQKQQEEEQNKENRVFLGHLQEQLAKVKDFGLRDTASPQEVYSCGETDL